jgi:hypothetical protein
MPLALMMLARSSDGPRGRDGLEGRHMAGVEAGTGAGSLAVVALDGG